jgi:hypothetical protein
MIWIETTDDFGHPLLILPTQIVTVEARADGTLSTITLTDGRLLLGGESPAVVITKLNSAVSPRSLELLLGPDQFDPAILTRQTEPPPVVEKFSGRYVHRIIGVRG